MNNIVDMCPLTKIEGRLNLLDEEDDDAVIWLESTATAAFANAPGMTGEMIGVELCLPLSAVTRLCRV